MEILLTGDYFYDSKVDEPDFEEIKKAFLEYDTVVINYEGSLPSSEKIFKAVNLEMSINSLDLPSNFVLSLANNHIFDFGAKGLDKTVEAISSRCIPYFGLETHSNANDHMMICEVADMSICFVGFGWKNEECKVSEKRRAGVVNLNKKEIDRTFKKIDRLNCDIVIVYVHAGYEFEYYPLPLHVGLSRYLIDSGADLVYGSHTHCIQPYEVYKGKYIFYGLGNFYFGSRREKYPIESDYGIALSLTVKSQPKDIEVKAKDVIYHRETGETKIYHNSSFLEKNMYHFKLIEAYSGKYKELRTRKKNPRPILYYNSGLSNSLKYYLWLSIVRLTGFLGIRVFIKKLLGWI